MKRPSHPLLTGLLAACVVCALCACAKKPVAPPDIIPVSAQNFDLEVLRQPGVTLVLFHTDAWQSQEMYRRLQWLSENYRGQLKFCAFAWNMADDPSPYRLEMLPTLVMYRDGWEVDRMRGIPSGQEAMHGLADDLELWVLRTGLQLTDDPRFQATFSYRFNNTSRLVPGNFAREQPQ